MKQETLEEAILERKFKSNYIFSPDSFVEGVKWQAERMYSEEDLKEAFKQSRQAFIFEKDMPPVYENFEEWFEQFKRNSYEHSNSAQSLKILHDAQSTGHPGR
jgi:hypothetical protein